MGSALSVLMIDRSAVLRTVVLSVSESLAEAGSFVAEETVAVLLIVPPEAGAVTVIVRAGALPGVRLGLEQMTVPAVWLQVQPVPEAMPKAAPAGRVSVTVTAEA